MSFFSIFIRFVFYSSFSVLLLFAGCGGKQSVDPDSYTEAAAFDYASVEQVFERKDYDLARSQFAEIAREYPYSQFATLSELRIADCYFMEHGFPQAIDAYRRFVRFHPRHEEVLYAESQIVRAYYEQMPNDWFLMPPVYERELGTAESAYQALRLFLTSYPETIYSEELAVLYEEVMNRLADHELYVAEFYIDRDNYIAAGRRSSYLLTNYPEANAVPEALFLYARVMLETNDTEQASETLHRLAEEFPDHQLGRDAAQYIERYSL